ncbi:MAG: helix-turn-helix domain-containing protein [Anaerolineae bacterium]
MAEGLGHWLRRTRETRNLSLDEVEAALRIRKRFLQALEVGDYAALPGPIQARGFIRNYARFLRLPVEEALARYEAEVQGVPFRPEMQSADLHPGYLGIDRPTVFAPPPSEEEETGRAAGGLPPLFWLLIGAMVLFGLIALVSFLYLEFRGRAAQPQSTPPPPTAAVTTAPVLPSTSEEEAHPAFVPAADGTVTVRLVPQAHAWVRVIADETVVFQGVATPDQSVEATASERCTVETGNGGAFQLFLNGEDFGPLGQQGEIVRRAWSPAGEVSPGDS